MKCPSRLPDISPSGHIANAPCGHIENASRVPAVFIRMRLRTYFRKTGRDLIIATIVYFFIAWPNGLTRETFENLSFVKGWAWTSYLHYVSIYEIFVVRAPTDVVCTTAPTLFCLGDYVELVDRLMLSWLGLEGAAGWTIRVTFAAFFTFPMLLCSLLLTMEKTADRLTRQYRVWRRITRKRLERKMQSE